MSDTHPEVAEHYSRLLLARSGEERLLMAMGAFDSAREIALAGLRAAHPDADATELRVLLFLRFYGGDLDAETVAGVIARIRA